MDKYMNSGIKAVISKFPKVGEILLENSIGCVTCSVGTCLLKDVIQVHGLNKNQEAVVMARIEKVIYPERDVKIPVQNDLKLDSEVKTIKYSPPIKKLVEEHDRIKRFLSLVPLICNKIEKEDKIDKQVVEDSVYFIRNYADKFHHAKEEDILFKYTDESQDIIKVMYEDHNTGRNFVKAIIDGLEHGDSKAIINNFLGYRELLSQHIKKEDEILYPWFDKNLSTKQIGELANEFSKVDDKAGNDITKEFEDFLGIFKI